MIKRLVKATITTLFVASTLAVTAADNNNSDPFSFTKGNTSVKVGGFATLTTGSYLSGSNGSNNDFLPSAIPTVTPLSDESRLIFDPSSTRLNLSVTQSTEKIGDIKLYVEIDFRGSSNTIRMRHAYFTVKGFTFGQTWSIMTDGAANAPTIDVQGVNARSYFRVPQISYKHSLTDQISMGASIEMQTITITSPSGEIESAVSKAPDFGLFAQSKGALGHIRFSTILRSMPYIYNNEKQNQFGWGVQLTGTLNATKSLRFYGQSIYGHGIGRYINDLMSQSMDVVESVSSPYDVNALPMYGASIGLKYDFTKKLYLSACYGSVKVMDSDDVLSSSDFRSSEFISTTLFYAPIKSLLFGFEYLHGARINVDKSTGVANKINLMTRYLF